MLVVESDFQTRPIPFSHILLVFACAMTSAILLAGCKPTPDKKLLSPAAVEVAAVVPKPIRLSDEFNGRIASINSVDLRGRVTGYVDKVAYREGDSVKRGDLLFIIDPRPYPEVLAIATATREARAAPPQFHSTPEKRD